MNNNLSPLRPAMTAIAAVIALSSTPLFAQATDSPADQAAPAVVAPPPPVETAPPVAAQTAAPELAAPVVAPAPAMKTVGTPVVHDADTTATAAPSAAAPTQAAPLKRISTTSAAHKSAPVATASVTPAKVAPASRPAPVVKNVPTASETAAATPAAAPAPAATTTQTTHVSAIDEDALPVVGGVGLAVIALGGAAAFAIRRRREEREEDALLLEPAPVEAVADRGPAVVATVAPAAKTRGRTPKTLPNGFDISRFGRHTQAAYLGPTEDNPSFSLKRRLKRASFFDQREREAAEAAASAKVEKKVAEAPVAQAAAAKQTAKDDGQVTIRLAPQRKRSGAGYLLQR